VWLVMRTVVKLVVVAPNQLVVVVATDKEVVI
jgi:hypothetical protein